MSRPDLPEGFGGWQVLDGTPQELSDGVSLHVWHFQVKQDIKMCLMLNLY